MEISFYHLNSMALEKALPRLLEKIIESGARVLLLIKDQERMKIFDNFIWTFASLSFIPHGTKFDANPQNQPIYLTDNITDNANNASIIMTADGEIFDTDYGFKKYIDIFHGQDGEQLLEARNRWKLYKQDDSKNLVYWKQNADGKWDNTKSRN